ncbi:MAG TPA: hypothetical protein VFW44_13665 [Bryobacteraceae bacterium]|nr:hypothetical protein [Bryobacteraceae bacterium]
MTTFTVYNPNSGTELGRGLTAAEAAQEILGHDGHDYELRRDGEAFQLFVSRGSRNANGGNRGLTEAYSHSRLIRSYAATEAAAWEEIADQVIHAGWESVPVQVVSDADYDAMIAEIGE